MKKKFLIVTTVSDSLPFFKGQIDVLKESFDVSLISSPGIHLEEMSELHSVPHYAVKMRREISLFSDLISLLNLVNLFYNIKPFIVHGNTPKAGLLSMVAAYFVGVPKRIYYVHGLRYQGKSGISRRILMIMERITCGFATDVIAVGAGVKTVLINDKICKKEIALIGNGSINGIDLDFFNPLAVTTNLRYNYNISEDDFVFGFVGRLVRDKGINELVRAFTIINEENKNSKLLLVGSFERVSDPLEISTIKAIETNPHIIHANFQRDVRPFFNAMNVFVFPSYREGLGNVLIEAGAMNLPVITSDITGCTDIIQDNYNGFLISSKNDNALLEKMLYCMNNREVIKKMGMKGRSRIVERFDQQKVWHESLRRYKTIAAD